MNRSKLVHGWKTAAVVAGRSVASVRKLVKQGKLVAAKGKDDSHTFRREDLEALPPVPPASRISSSRGRVSDAKLDRRLRDAVKHLVDETPSLAAAVLEAREWLFPSAR